MEQLVEQLICPFTLELFQDPISLPCCGNSVSRRPMTESFHINPRCPVCRADLITDYPTFDPLTAPKDVVSAGLIDRILASDIKVPRAHQWSASLTRVCKPDNTPLPIAELVLKLKDARFRPRPCLFVPVVDRSGSMSGSPWKQVETALLHILGLVKTNDMVKLEIIAYESSAELIRLTEDHKQNQEIIKRMFTGGGTNFRAAFQELSKLLDRYADGSVSSINVAFLTDGQSGENHELLIDALKEAVSEKIPVIIHTIGFSQWCEKPLLEGMRLVGQEEGTFRYAEPQDDGDTLCHKLTSLFEYSASGSIVPVTLELKHARWYNTAPHCISIDGRRKGTIKTWIHDDLGSEGCQLWVTTAEDQLVEIKVHNEPDTYQAELYRRFLSQHIDGIADELLKLSNESSNISDDILQLHTGLIIQRLSALSNKLPDEKSISYLLDQTQALRKRQSVNTGKLGDLRFNSRFDSSVTASTSNKHIPQQQVVLIDTKEEKKQVEWQEKPVRYSYNNDGKQRNILQERIMSLDNVHGFELDDTVTLEDVIHTDINGNNALHLAAYGGCFKTVTSILQRFPQLNMEVENNDHETAVTLAIKKRGYHKTVEILLNHGATIPRYKYMEQYAIAYKFPRTAKLIAQRGDTSVGVDLSVSADYLRFKYEQFADDDRLEPNQYLQVALFHGLVDLVRVLVDKHGAHTNLHDFLAYTIPPKPDDPDTDRYIDLVLALIKTHPRLIHDHDSETGDTALIRSAAQGSLPHVQLFLSMGVQVDDPNDLGNTALWVACAKRYPCIIDELLKHNADVNWVNKQGNIPMYPICTRGPIKIAERLLAAGASLECVNHNGDTLVLLACRNGQHELLDLFLNYATPELVAKKAHIDGFNALFASVEADRPDCVRVLHKYGINLDQTTDDHNDILPGATPVHLASYYGRLSSLNTLLELGASINTVDVNGMTALHIAALKGQGLIMKCLLKYGGNIQQQDYSGNTPLSYCRSNPELREILIDPLVDSLMKWARGGMSHPDAKLASELLVNYAGCTGCLTSQEAIDIRDASGKTALTIAVIHSNVEAVTTLLALGANPLLEYKSDMNATVWAYWIKHPKIFRQFSEQKSIALERLMKYNNNPILFLGRPQSSFFSESSLSLRMSRYLNTTTLIHTTPLRTITDGESQGESQWSEPEWPLWSAKVQTIETIASLPHTLLRPVEILALALYTGHPNVSQVINENILQTTQHERISVLYHALQKLTPFCGEVFIGSDQVQRRLFRVGDEVSWPTFISGTTMWPLAVDNIQDFSKKGTVFIIKSLKQGKLISNYSPFPFDGEVIFSPWTKFQVTNWYQGNVIALGQTNIRQKSYGVSMEEADKLSTNDKSLIIELTEFSS